MGADELNLTGPVLSLSQLSLVFSGTEGESNPAAQTIEIRNIGTGLLNWSVTEDCSWLEVVPDIGSTNDINEVSVFVDINGLSLGAYNCSFAVDSNNSINGQIDVSVTLNIFGDYAGGLHVPIEYANIQAAINDANDGDVVVVGDGIWTGTGNRDIDLLGKKITVRSENGASKCIIDLDASVADPHRGFILQSGEDANTVICGFTIKNGYSDDYGSAVLCGLSFMSIIKDCIFVNNSGRGAVYLGGYSNEVINCTFNDNQADYGGGAIVVPCYRESTIKNCIIWDNTPDDFGISGSCEKGSYFPTVSFSMLTVAPWWLDVNDGNNMINIDPCFYDAANQDYHLRWDSPCINAGDPNYIAGPNDIDMDGESRVIEGRIDIGADELDPNKPFLKVEPRNLYFEASEGGANPAGQLLYIYNPLQTGGFLNWQLTEDCNWLTAEPNTGIWSGETNEVLISVDITGMSGGDYLCNIVVEDPCAYGSPYPVEVHLDLEGPLIELSDKFFNFHADWNDGNNPADQTLTIHNSGAGTLNWTITDDGDWLEADPNSGSSTGPGEPNDVVLSVDITGLSAGIYDCNLIVSDPNADNSPQTVKVTLKQPCIPFSHPDYQEWKNVGEPDCWCYPRQCHGDADGLYEGDPKPGFLYVWSADLSQLAAGWKQPYSGSPLLDGPDPDSKPDTWICADFDHNTDGDPKTGYFRVWSGDVSILVANWKTNPPPDCLD
jgi:hypothetical protein